MKIIKYGKVYDMCYGEYDVITNLPVKWVPNELKNEVRIERELRRDKVNNEFYVCTFNHGYSRSSYDIKPLTEAEAAAIAENFIDYEEYIKFFRDPEGYSMQMKREHDDAIKEAKEASKARDYWVEAYTKKTQYIEELEARLSKIQDKLNELTIGGEK